MFIPKLSSSISNIVHLPLQKLNPTRFLTKAADVVEITSEKFTPLEKRLMDEVREYSRKSGLETARIIDKQGKLVDMELWENPFYVTAISKKNIKVFNYDFGITGRIIKTLTANHKSTMIHSHVANSPLSSQDLRPLIFRIYKKIIATTPDGSFSSIERLNDFGNIFKLKKMLKARKGIAESQLKKASELKLMEKGHLKLTADAETFKEYSNFSIKLIQDFADKFGFKFEHNYSTSTKT